MKKLLLFIILVLPWGCESHHHTAPAPPVNQAAERSEAPRLNSQSFSLAYTLDTLMCRGDANQDQTINLRDYYAFREQLSAQRFDIVAFAHWREMIVDAGLLCISDMTYMPEGAWRVTGMRLDSAEARWGAPTAISETQVIIPGARCAEISFTYREVDYQLTPPPQAETCNALDDDCDGHIDEALLESCSDQGLSLIGELSWGSGAEGQLTSTPPSTLTSPRYRLTPFHLTLSPALP